MLINSTLGNYFEDSLGYLLVEVTHVNFEQSIVLFGNISHNFSNLLLRRYSAKIIRGYIFIIMNYDPFTRREEGNYLIENHIASVNCDRYEGAFL